jgi:diaminopimelate epimerase
MRFEKWQALGNDYIVVEAGSLPWELTPERIRRICEPHFGVGSDGILLLSPADDDRHVAALRIFNPDGSEAELSGNGAREAVLYLREAGWTGADTFTIVTKAGAVTPTITGPGEVSMAIGRATDHGTGTVESAGREWSFRHVNVGNPQCVIEAGDEVEDLDLAAIGPAIEGNTELFPNRTNVHQRQRVDGARTDLRARGGGDALLGHRCERGSGGGLPGRRREPDHGAARWRRAHGRNL